MAMIDAAVVGDRSPRTKKAALLEHSRRKAAFSVVAQLQQEALANRHHYTARDDDTPAPPEPSPLDSAQSRRAARLDR